MEIFNVLYFHVFWLNVVSICNSAHFRGGTISWKPLGGYKVEFKFKMAWSYGSGPGCTETKIGQYVQGNFVGDKNWNCVDGCGTATAVGTVYYFCTAVDKQENWEQGENTFEYSFPSKGPFIVSYVGAMWIQLGVRFSDYNGRWNLQTIVQIEQRSDTKLPNSSPITASKPLYILQYQCKHNIQLPMVDPDGDTVKCRWAVGKECDSICNTVPVAKLNEDTCSIQFEADNYHFVENGWYAAAITIEDFPKKPMTIGNTTYNETTPITQVPLQFVIHIVKKTLDCDWRPFFVPPTPAEGSHITVAANDSVHTRLYASNARNPSANVTAMSLTSPKGMTNKGPFPDKSRPGVVYWELQWTPTESQIGDNIVCGMAEDSVGQHSDTCCFTYIAWDNDPCASEPCNNNGTCARRGSTQNYDCICAGFTGTLCETEIDECESNPCQHGGTCKDKINAFECSCRAGYQGNVCMINIDECSSHPCKNKATCVDGINSYTCVCSPGYTGIQCETDANECISIPCQNNGTCTDYINKYTCTCLPGFRGDNCEIDTDDCVPNPCKNKGICQDKVSGFHCICPAGYTGATCESDIDECSIRPCQNGGTCNDQLNDYSCTCVPGYNGKSCETDIDECFRRPCEHGAFCIDLVNGYSCTCAPGFTGTNCETDLDDCHSNPCSNGSVCHDQVNGYVCSCVSGYAYVCGCMSGNTGKNFLISYKFQAPENSDQC